MAGENGAKNGKGLRQSRKKGAQEVSAADGDRKKKGTKKEDKTSADGGISYHSSVCFIPNSSSIFEINSSSNGWVSSFFKL